jgi:hypothetical protein
MVVEMVMIKPLVITLHACCLKTFLSVSWMEQLSIIQRRTLNASSRTPVTLVAAVSSPLFWYATWEGIIKISTLSRYVMMDYNKNTSRGASLINSTPLLRRWISTETHQFFFLFSPTTTQCVCNNGAVTQAPVIPIPDDGDGTNRTNSTDPGGIIDFPGVDPDACVNYDNATMEHHAELPPQAFTACHHSYECGEDAGYDGSYCCSDTPFCMCLKWNTTDKKRSWCVWP